MVTASMDDERFIPNHQFFREPAVVIINEADEDELEEEEEEENEDELETDDEGNEF